MSDAIIVALITGGLTLLGTVVTCVATTRTSFAKLQTQLQIQQAVTDTKLEELTRETRAHNNFAQRIPTLEAQVEAIKRELFERR